MIEDLLSLKAATIGRCGSRDHEEYARALNTFAADRPALDAATLKILRTCRATRETGQNLIHRECLGDRHSARVVLMMVPTLPRGHASRPLLRLDAKRPEFGLPRWSVGAINRIEDSNGRLRKSV